MPFKSKFLNKRAYGLDQSDTGDIDTGSENAANEANQDNLEDTTEEHHETSNNPANVLVDTEALKEFPEELEKTSVTWPARS